MAFFKPGAQCLLRFGEELWPAVLIEENMIPEEVNVDRLKGYYLPAFVIGKDIV